MNDADKHPLRWGAWIELDPAKKRCSCGYMGMTAHVDGFWTPYHKYAALQSALEIERQNVAFLQARLEAAEMALYDMEDALDKVDPEADDPMASYVKCWQEAIGVFWTWFQKYHPIDHS